MKQCICGKNISLRAKYCKPCADKNRIGRHHTEESKRKIGLNGFHYGMKGKKHNQEWKDKQSERMKKSGSPWNIGRKKTEEERKKQSEMAKEKGFGKWMIGKKLSEETKKKVSIASKGRKCHPDIKKRLSEARMRENNPGWKGGLSFENYGHDWTDTLRESIRERDNHICKMCGDAQEKTLDVHHIDYNKKNCNPDNLISLCRYCHLKTNNNREYWINYFKKYE